MDDLALKKQLLEEMAKFAQSGMARDMRERFGRPLDDMPPEGESAEAMPEEEAAENPAIPGVEASEPGEAMGEESELDAETLQALLASMKGG